MLPKTKDMAMMIEVSDTHRDPTATLKMPRDMPIAIRVKIAIKTRLRSTSIKDPRSSWRDDTSGLGYPARPIPLSRDLT